MKRLAVFALLLILLPDPAGAQSAPSAFTGSVSGVAAQSAVITGDVNPNGHSSTAWFEYGTSFSLGSRTQTEFVGSGSGPVRIAATLSGLQPNTTYYYRVVAQGSSFGTQYGSILTFTTLSSGGGTGTGVGLPSVQLHPSTNLDSNSISLHGRILPNGSDTTAWFEYGTTASLGIRSESRPVLATQAGLELNFHLGALRPGTKYYYRLAAQNSQGLANTEVRSFTTLGAPKPTTPAPATTTPTSTPAPTSTTVNPAFNAVLTLIATADQSEPPLGSEFNYNLEYRNEGANAASGTVLRVTLPPEVEFVMADIVPNVEGRNLSFAIGRVPGGERKSIRIRLRALADAEPKQISLPALLTYRTPRNEERSATANLSLNLTETPAVSTSTREFGGLRWYTWLFLFLLLVIALAVGYVFYRYGKSKRILG